MRISYTRRRFASTRVPFYGCFMGCIFYRAFAPRYTADAFHNACHLTTISERTPTTYCRLTYEHHRRHLAAHSCYGQRTHISRAARAPVEHRKYLCCVTVARLAGCASSAPSHTAAFFASTASADLVCPCGDMNDNERLSVCRRRGILSPKYQHHLLHYHKLPPLLPKHGSCCKDFGQTRLISMVLPLRAVCIWWRLPGWDDSASGGRHRRTWTSGHDRGVADRTGTVRLTRSASAAPVRGITTTSRTGLLARGSSILRACRHSTRTSLRIARTHASHAHAHTCISLHTFAPSFYLPRTHTRLAHAPHFPPCTPVHLPASRHTPRAFRATGPSHTLFFAHCHASRAVTRAYINAHLCYLINAFVRYKTSQRGLLICLVRLISRVHSGIYFCALVARMRASCA